MPYFVYLLECRDRSLYCGYTNDLKKRVETHNAGKGGKYTARKRPVRLVYSERFGSRGEAMRREIEIKKMTRNEKLRLIRAA